MASKASSLLIAVQAQAALTPEQRQYNQLVVKIEKARAELLEWQEQVPLFERARGERMQPLIAELTAQRLLLLQQLSGLLGGRGWNPSERRTLRRALCELAADLTQSDAIDEATAAEIEALHDQHADTSLEAERRGALAGMKNMLEAAAGVDLGEAHFESEEALLQHAHQRLRDEAERQQQADAPPGRKPRPSAAQRKREAEAQLASQSVREVFRRLASALHPDRASDDADRGRRTALMQRVNQAYAAEDLLTLFALQLEIELVDAEHLARASSERMRHYNRVLATQLAELKQELESCAAAFGMQFGIEPGRRLNPRKLGSLLEEEVREIRGALVHVQLDMRVLNTPSGAKRWVKQMRQMQAQDDRDPFGLAF